MHANFPAVVAFWMLSVSEPAAAIVFQEAGQNLSMDGSCTDVAVGDFDGDADLDIIVAVAGGPSQLWINQGSAQGGLTGTFQNSGVR